MAVDTVTKQPVALEEALLQISTDLADNLKKSIDEMTRKMAESDVKHNAELDKLSQMNNAILQELRADADKVDKWIGYFGNSIGNIVELVLIPGIKQKMNDLGHNFNALSARKQYYDKNGKTYAEVDLLLENGEEVMVVEVKTQLSVKEIERQLKRLELLRKHESGASLKGKTIYSAVAGLQIDEDARETALGLGMYVVEMVEDAKSVNIIKPSGKLGKW